ncbi:MAG TPA: segregation/condensation protein A [Actinomycetota bacterium]|nr:segregation/condensation protein A [Actinomycetota bacterium]
MTYAVKLDVFEGPLDLLLHLISKERVNVADVCIADVTEEYLRATAALGEVDLETASSFLVLAATLLELKSLKLLPSRSTADPDLKLLLEERDRLLHRLIVYATFKQAASRLGERLAENAGYHPRSAELPEELAPAAPDIFRSLTPEMLAKAAVRALTPPDQPSVDTSHITRVTVSLEEMVAQLRARLETEKFSSFRRLCGSARGRIEVVIALLAVLELFKNQAVDIEQASPFGDIEISWKQPAPGAA